MYFKQELSNFNMAYIHGMNAFTHLGNAYQLWIRQQELESQIAELTEFDFFREGVPMVTTNRLYIEKFFSYLTQTIILYQASMEAILSMAAFGSSKVREAINKKGSTFNEGWKESCS